ncbi:MAG: retropepsin-like aspartic protease family protein [Sphingomicrobium sp.]
MTTPPDWQQIAIYAVAAALLILLLQRIPYIGRIVRFLFSLALLAFFLFLLIQQAPYQPELARLTERIGLDNQEVVGEEVRIRMARDGHFWVDATINGVSRRMLVDSGATVTAISDETAMRASVDRDLNLAPIVLRTAGGVVPARPVSIDELRVGNIVASNLKAVTSPGLGDLHVLGMNFLSELQSWRVEGRTLVLVPPDRQRSSS